MYSQCSVDTIATSECRGDRPSGGSDIRATGPTEQTRQSPVEFMRVLAFGYPNDTITVMLTAEYNLAPFSLNDAVVVLGSREVLKQSFNIILLDCPHRYITVRQFKAESGHKWTKHPLRITRVSRADEQAVVLADDTKLSQMTNIATVIVRIPNRFCPW